MNETPNYVEMPENRLKERSEELSSLLNLFEHCPERKEQIQRELSSIAFETIMWKKDLSVEIESLISV